MKLKPIVILLLITLAAIPLEAQTPVTPNVSSEASRPGYFPLSDADIYTDSKDYHVVSITANMFADDVERVTGKRPHVAITGLVKSIPKGVAVVVGTVGKSRLIDELIRQKSIDVSAVKGKWESYIVTTVNRFGQGQLLVIAGSDRRGTAFGLTTTISTCCQVFQPSALYVHPYLQVKWSKDLHIEV